MKEKIKRLATKAELKAQQDKTVKLQRYDLIFFIGEYKASYPSNLVNLFIE